MSIESAIPDHLQVERVHPAGRDEDFIPVVPAVCARLDESVTQVAMAYFGLQYTEPELPAHGRRALDELNAVGDPRHAPTHGFQAQYVDEAGFTTLLAIRYWPAVSAYDGWRTERREWTDPARERDGVGFFSEVITPTADRFETVFSEGDELEGVAVNVGRPSGPIREHGYWGSARDRLPASQTDPLKPSGEPAVVTDGDLRIVRPLGNLTLIQSGQDWSSAPEQTQRIYLQDVEPALRTAMDYLVDHPAETGCIANRYLRVLDGDGRERDRSFGLSWWRDLRDLEQWAAEHPTHVAVFTSAMPVLMDPDPARRVWLYHEVSVTTPEQQDFRYLGCHDRTGLLNLG